MDISTSNIFSVINNTTIPKRYRSVKYMSALTYRVCSRIASKYSDEFENETMAGALYIYVMPYLYFCLPMKQVARQAQQKSETIDIHLARTVFPVMTMWEYGELPLFALAIFAQRLGVPFRFHSAELDKKPVLTFRPAPVLVPEPCFNYEYRNFPSRTLICTAGFRDFAVLPPGEVNVSFIWARAGYRRMLATDVGFRMDPRPFYAPYMEIWPERHEDRDFINNMPDMKAILDGFFAPVLDASLKEAHKLVAEADIRKLYVSDSPFLETWVLKEAVAARGGEVALVPHGYNKGLIQAGESDDISTIITPCWSTAEQWTHYSRATIKVQSAISRNRSAKRVGAFDPARPGVIHIFGCDEFVGSVPRFHEGTKPLDKYVALLNGLVASPFALYFRERKLGVTIGMLKETFPGERLQWGTKAPSETEGENMVFIFVGPATSGVHEAIGRGIPVIRIKEQEDEEYLLVDEDIVPVLSPQDASALACELATGRGYDALVRKQAQWFTAETRDGEIASPDM